MVTGVDHPGDRRKPRSRYAQFDDDAVQALFVAAANQAYQLLMAWDDAAEAAEAALPEEPPPAQERRGLFRRRPAPAPEPAPAPRPPADAQAALARVAQDTVVIPGEMKSSGHRCKSFALVAQVLARVGRPLVEDLMALPPGEQATHPAYEQTMRLGAELEALRVVAQQTTCTDPDGCVGIRLPDQWQRRVEDREVSEVLDELRFLALGDSRDRQDD